MMCLEVKMPLALLTSAYDSILDAERSYDITSSIRSKPMKIQMSECLNTNYVFFSSRLLQWIS